MRPMSKRIDKLSPIVNGMSIDVEDYFQVWALSEKISPQEWDGFSLRVEGATRKAMDLLERHGAHGTFFTLAWVAKKCPKLVREIVERGHELGSHGMAHKKVFDENAAEFLTDAETSKRILEDIAGVAVNGFRAAGFSFDRRTPWAYEKLCEAGYLYSSSLHPIAHDHYANAEAPTSPFKPDQDLPIIELPVATVERFGRRFTCAGGGWFRLLPYRWSQSLWRSLNNHRHLPGIFYFHPWEIDPEQPKVTGLSARSRFRHYTNLDHMEKKLEKLLADFHWARLDAIYLDDVLENVA